MSFYMLAKFLTGLVLKIGGARVIGRENIPEDKSLVVIANHSSFGDPPAVSYAFDRPITYIAKEDFAKNFFTKVLFGAGGVIFLKAKDSDLTAMRTAIKALKEEKTVCIFPEGKRNFDQQMTEFKPGAAYIAYRAGVKVLPLAVINAGDYWRIWRRNIIINVGQPIVLDKETKFDQAYLDRYNELFEQKVRDLFAENAAIIAKEGKKMRRVPKKYR